MIRLLEILRIEFESELRLGVQYTSKKRLMASFDKACVRAITKYAEEMGFSITIKENEL